MQATKQQKEAIKKAVRAANRRVERAQEKYPGMANYLESLVKRATGAPKFSAKTKGLTYEQAAKKIEELNRFMSRDITTITGWKKEKAENVKKGAEALQRKGYDLTDEEFGEILKQVDAKNKTELYSSINKVQAAKEEAGEDWEGSDQEIADAIAEKISAQEALERAIGARPEIDARRSGKLNND